MQVADLNDELMGKASDRFNVIHPLKDKYVSGFRHLGLVYVAELVVDKVTDKVDKLLVHFTLNVYTLDDEEKEKIPVGPQMPHENRVKRFHLPKKVLVLTRSSNADMEKEV